MHYATQLLDSNIVVSLLGTARQRRSPVVVSDAALDRVRSIVASKDRVRSLGEVWAYPEFLRGSDIASGALPRRRGPQHIDAGSPRDGHCDGRSVPTAREVEVIAQETPAARISRRGHDSRAIDMLEQE